MTTRFWVCFFVFVFFLRKRNVQYIRVCSVHLAGNVAFLLPAVNSSLGLSAQPKLQGFDTYGLGELCRAGTEVDDFFLLHVQMSDVPSARLLGAALTLDLGWMSAPLHTSETLNCLTVQRCVWRTSESFPLRSV